MLDNVLGNKKATELEAEIEAVGRSQAIIRFRPDGTILEANDNFLNALGYRLDEIVGQHHKIFVDSKYANSHEYKKFWEDLARGEYKSEQFKRFTKQGKEIWIEASYNPVFNKQGQVVKIVKYATDITNSKLQGADYRGQLEAISKAQAVIEFKLDGTILTANKNFLNTVGYQLAEIQGQHHSIFVDPVERQGAAYKQFWKDLAVGEFKSGEFKRFGKDSKEIWIQASYNPILDMNGRPFKVVKYATDITASKLQNADYEGQLAAISKSQAIIEFDLNGKIQFANENFLTTVGYSLNEIKGQHHRLFVDTQERESAEYKKFWEDLKSGVYKSGEFKRFGKGGKEIWIQASYNPIFDMNGKPFKIVKYASDITAQKQEKEEIKAKLSSSVLSSAEEANYLSAELKSYLSGVGTATEEMISSIAEISKNTESSTNLTKTVVDQIERASEVLQSLQKSSEEIGDILKMVTEIASQTNLLALNATIEAARAGDAGKGFAVVATEVKELASRTAEATEDIRAKIASIQSESHRAINSVTSAMDSVRDVNSSVVSIASALEEQTAVTNEIGRSVNNANTKVVEVVAGIGHIKGSVELNIQAI